MAPLPIVLITLSALAHAYWNFLAKRATATQAFFALSVLAEVVIFLPVFIVWAIVEPLPPLKYWWLMLVAAAFNPLFFFFLGKAYQRGALSLVYPATRAGSLAFLPLLALIFIGERIDWLGGVAIALIVVGIGILQLEELNGQSMKALLRSAGSWSAMGYALIAALLTAAFTLWDKYAVSILPVFFYYYIYTAISALGYYAIIAIGRSRQLLIDESRLHLRDILQVGFFSMSGYVLVLFALQTDKASYVIALRQLSIGIGALMGRLWLGERLSPHRWVGLAVLLGGCAVVSLAR